MYNTTDTYKSAVRALSRQDNLTGTITFSNGSSQTITTGQTETNDTAVISEGSVSILWQCVNNDELMFGGAILSSLDISIRTNKSRYAFYGAKIELTYQVLTEDGWEDVPLGVYTVTEADKSGIIVKLVAYDNLQLLDVSFGDAVLLGTAFELFDQIHDKTGLELGFDADYISTWVNVDEIIQIDETSGCQTFRDAVKIICQMIGCFASVDRFGKLMVYRFNTEVDTVLTSGDRYSLTVADYQCNYISLSVTSSSGTYEVLASDVKQDDSGLTMVMTDAPAWDYGLEDTLKLRAQALCDYLHTITYTPTDIELPGDPSIECGDRIKLTTDDGDVETIITSVEWKYHNSMTLESVGINPYLESATARTISNRILNAETEGNKLAMYNFTNYSAVEIGDSEEKLIASTDFSASGDTTALFIANIKIKTIVDDSTTTTEETKEVPIKILDSDGNETTLLDADGNPLTFSASVTTKDTDTTPGYVDIAVRYELDETEIEYYPTEHYSNGEHLLALYYPLTAISANHLYSFQIYITATGGSAFIDEYWVEATIFGQYMGSGTIEWDGKIEVEETVEPIDLSTVRAKIASITDEVSTWLDTPTESGLSDVVLPIKLTNTIKISGITENYGTSDVIDVVITQQTVTFSSKDNKYVTTDDDSNIVLNQTYQYDKNKSEEIDEGTMNSLAIETSDKASVSAIEVTKQ